MISVLLGCPAPSVGYWYLVFQDEMLVSSRVTDFLTLKLETAALFGNVMHQLPSDMASHSRRTAIYYYWIPGCGLYLPLYPVATLLPISKGNVAEYKANI
jgi:hypothetical protein